MGASRDFASHAAAAVFLSRDPVRQQEMSGMWLFQAVEVFVSCLESRHARHLGSSIVQAVPWSGQAVCRGIKGCLWPSHLQNVSCLQQTGLLAFRAL